MRPVRQHIRLRRSVEKLSSRLARARYFRGHGVHSPFVYAIVRCVFMKRRLSEGPADLYRALRGCGVPERRAVELQNLAHHCGYATFSIDGVPAAAELVLLTAAAPSAAIAPAAEEARRRKTTLCILDPYADRERQAACAAATEAHPCTSVDNRGYLLLFNNHLPRQRFKL